MDSEQTRRFSFAVAVVLGLVLGCTQIDVYPGPRLHGAHDAGVSPTDAAVSHDGSDRAGCEQCVATACEAEWQSCQGDADCLSCLDDPRSDACKRSLTRHDFRNCACARSTCLNACPTLCPVPPPPTAGTDPIRVPQDCITCTAAKCGPEVNACVTDPLCLSCVNDSRNPKCSASPPWNDTLDCLCGPPGACFEECCVARP